MADDSLEGMPEFDKPENIPLVVPDLTPVKPRCQSTKKDGITPCKVPPLKGEKYCLGHSKALAPELRDKWRRLGRGIPKTDRTIRRQLPYYTKDDLLGFLSKRLDLVKERFGEMCDAATEEMICNIVRTMAAVYKIEAIEAEKENPGFRMRGAV